MPEDRAFYTYGDGCSKPMISEINRKAWKGFLQPVMGLLIGIVLVGLAFAIPRLLHGLPTRPCPMPVSFRVSPVEGKVAVFKFRPPLSGTYTIVISDDHAVRKSQLVRPAMLETKVTIKDNNGNIVATADMSTEPNYYVGQGETTLITDCVPASLNANSDYTISCEYVAVRQKLSPDASLEIALSGSDTEGLLAYNGISAWSRMAINWLAYATGALGLIAGVGSCVAAIFNRKPQL